MRSRVASDGIDELRKCVDALIVIPNDRILSVVDASVPFKQALEKADEVLYNATKGIADIISHEGLINVDFADVATVMRNQGDALMGIGRASGDLRAIEAAQNALNSPILEGMQIYGAKGLLVNITGGSSLTLHEVSEAVSCVQKAAGEEANLIHGVVIDDYMDDEISVTVVATGFHEQEMAAKTTVVNNLTIVRSAGEEPDTRPLPSVPDDDAPSRPYRPAAVEEPSPILQPSGPVNKEDTEVPAIWRKKANQRAATASAQQPAHSSQASSTPASAPDQRERSPRPIATVEQVKDTADQPETFLRPRKSASSGGGSSQPAFLRKIMD
jgi:cell division protein FtsZ